eukprot:13634240-Alexandrium_andersonii.AAC.1
MPQFPRACLGLTEHPQLPRTPRAPPACQTPGRLEMPLLRRRQTTNSRPAKRLSPARWPLQAVSGAFRQKQKRWKAPKGA